MNWQNFRFEDPWFLLLFLVLPLMFFPRVRNKVTFIVPEISHLKEMHTWRSRLMPWLPLLKVFALCGAIIAMARPQLILVNEKVTTEGIDIVLAIDLSTSMLAQDFNPDRLTVSKQVAANFVRSRPYDRIGLVVFSGESFTQSPVTTDHSILLQQLVDISAGSLAEGTAIGMGLATAVNRLKESNSKSKIIILLTDGDNNMGYINPVTAAELAQEFDIRVYTIGVGTDGTALTPHGRKGDGTYEYRFARVNINEQLLKEIAGITGGKYFRARSEEQLEQIYSEIDDLEKTEREVETFKRYSDRYPAFAIFSVVCIFVYVVLKYTIFRSYP